MMRCQTNTIVMADLQNTMAQSAQAAKNRDLLALAQRCHPQTLRQTRWIKGLYQLTADDVRTGKRFPDAVARCAWGIEVHNTPDDVYWEGFGDGHAHSFRRPGNHRDPSRELQVHRRFRSLPHWSARAAYLALGCGISE